jgi:hypothetical protein
MLGAPVIGKPVTVFLYNEICTSTYVIFLRLLRLVFLVFELLYELMNSCIVLTDVVCVWTIPQSRTYSKTLLPV